MSTAKPCGRCNRVPAVAGEKYCKRCRGAVLFELKSSGYLQDTTETKRASEHIGRKARDARVIANDFGRDLEEEGRG